LPYSFASSASCFLDAETARGLSSSAGWFGMTDRHPERWSPDRRIRTTREYTAIKAGGTAFRGRHCLLLSLPREGDATRVGFVASRKSVGDAVWRNRARRRLREIVRRRWVRLADAQRWMVFIAFRSCLSASHGELVSDVESLLERAGAMVACDPRDA
jgi:ribonuclease P protein component